MILFELVTVLLEKIKKMREKWLADFCHFFKKFLIEIDKNLEMAIKLQKATFIFSKVLSIFRNGQKKFFLRYFENSKNPQNSQIFNHWVSHDDSNKKIQTSVKMALITFSFFDSPGILQNYMARRGGEI